MQDKYKSHVEPKLFLVEQWARDGVIDKDIAKKLGISKETFYKYKKIHVDFSESLKKGKEVIDYEVENALLKRAMGYDYIETKTVTGENSSVTTTTKHVTPDVTAQIFWLKNRKVAEWQKLEREKLELIRERNELERQRVELLKLKINPEIEEDIDNSLIEALNASAKLDWADHVEEVSQ